MVFSRLFGEQSGSEARAYIETMLILATADGDFSRQEVESMTAILANHPRTKGLSESDFKQIVEACQRDMAAQHVDARIRAIAGMLPQQSQRIDAIKIALVIAIADGRFDPTELSLLDKFQLAFGLSEAQVHQILNELTQR
jgi:tellurite resistance protein